MGRERYFKHKAFSRFQSPILSKNLKGAKTLDKVITFFSFLKQINRFTSNQFFYNYNF